MGGTISMDANTQMQQTLPDFMAPGKAFRIWRLIFAIITSLMIVGAVYEFTKPQKEPVRMSTQLDSGTYSYLDVAMVSNWLLDVSGDENYTIYEAMDPDGNWFLISLDQETYATLSKQFEAYQTYFTENPENFTLPAPIRLTGMTEYLLSDDAARIATVFEDATAADINAYYGSYYFNEGASDLFSGAMLYLLGTLLSGLFFLVLVLQGGSQRKNYQKSERRLYERGLLDIADAEFSAPQSIRFPKANLILSQRFVFSGGSGYILPYEEIGWAYQRTQRSYGIPVSKQIIAGLVNGKTVVLASRGVNDQVLTDTARAIYTANPNCLIGYSFDNIKLYQERVKEYKQANPK